MMLKVVGDIGLGGLGYVNTILISRCNKVQSPIKFCIDTGSSITIICYLDAIRIGLDYNSLEKSDQQTINGVGVFTPYILSDTDILFINSEGTISCISEYVGNIHVMPPPHSSANTSKINDENNNSNNQIQMSLLGMDVLKNFTISFSQNKIILSK